MHAYKTLSTAYMLQFSHVAPDNGIAIMNDDGVPTPEAIDIGFELTNAQPMLAFIFYAEEKGAPNIHTIANVMREGYVKTSNNTKLNESYGLLLDALRQVAEMKDVSSKTLAHGALLQASGEICCLRIAPITLFEM